MSATRCKTHYAQDDDGKEQIDYRGQRLAGQEVPDVLQFAHARDRVAHPPRLEIRQRQRQQMPEQARAKLDIDAAGGVRKHIITQAGEKTSKSEHTSKAMHTTLRVL